MKKDFPPRLVASIIWNWFPLALADFRFSISLLGTSMGSSKPQPPPSLEIPPCSSQMDIFTLSLDTEESPFSP